MLFRSYYSSDRLYTSPGGFGKLEPGFALSSQLAVFVSLHSFFWLPAQLEVSLTRTATSRGGRIRSTHRFRRGHKSNYDLCSPEHVHPRCSSPFRSFHIHDAWPRHHQRASRKALAHQAIENHQNLRYRRRPLLSDSRWRGWDDVCAECRHGRMV